MKKSYLLALLTLTCLLGVGVTAHAQDVDGVVVTVPFAFEAGGANLPAGDYRIKRANPGVNRELAITGYNKGGAFLLPLAYAQETSDEPTLSFAQLGGRYYLSEVKTLSGVYTLQVPRAAIALAQTNSHSTLSSSGTN